MLMNNAKSFYSVHKFYLFFLKFKNKKSTDILVLFTMTYWHFYSSQISEHCSASYSHSFTHSSLSCSFRNGWDLQLSLQPFNSRSQSPRHSHSAVHSSVSILHSRRHPITSGLSITSSSKRHFVEHSNSSFVQSLLHLTDSCCADPEEQLNKKPVMAIQSIALPIPIFAVWC